MKLFPKTWLPLAGLAFAIAAPAPAAEADKLLPGDAEGVVVINFRQILDAPVVKKYALAQVKAALTKDEKASKIMAAAGIDPLKDVDTVTIAGSGNPTSNKFLAVVRGRFDIGKIGTVLEEQAKKDDGKLKISKEGDLKIYEIKGDDKPTFAAFKDEKTLVLSQAKETTADVASGKASSKPGKAMVGALDKIDAKDSMYLALVITDEMKKAMAKNPQTAAIAPKIEAITGSLSLTEALLATILIHTSDEEAADQVKMLVNQVKPFLEVLAQANEGEATTREMVNQILANLKVDSTKKAVSITLKLSEDLVKKLNEKAGNK